MPFVLYLCLGLWGFSTKQAGLNRLPRYERVERGLRRAATPGVCGFCLWRRAPALLLPGVSRLCVRVSALAPVCFSAGPPELLRVQVAVTTGLQPAAPFRLHARRSWRGAGAFAAAVPA